MVTMIGQADDALGGDGQIAVRCSVPSTPTGASAFVTGRAASLASSGVVSLASPGDLDVDCNDSNDLGTPQHFVSGGLTAIQVDKGRVQ